MFLDILLGCAICFFNIASDNNKPPQSQLKYWFNVTFRHVVNNITGYAFIKRLAISISSGVPYHRSKHGFFC